MSAFDGTTVFTRGAENTAFAQYFVGQIYLNMLTTEGVYRQRFGCRGGNQR